MIVFRWVHLPLLISMTANPLHSVVDLPIFFSFFPISHQSSERNGLTGVYYRVCLDSTLLFPGQWDAALRP